MFDAQLVKSGVDHEKTAVSIYKLTRLTATKVTTFTLLSVTH